MAARPRTSRRPAFVNRAGKIAFRAERTQADVLEWAVANLVGAVEARRAGQRVVLYYLEMLPVRAVDPASAASVAKTWRLKP